MYYKPPISFVHGISRSNGNQANDIGISFQFMVLQQLREIVTTYVEVGLYDSCALFPRIHTFLSIVMRTIVYFIPIKTWLESWAEFFYKLPFLS